MNRTPYKSGFCILLAGILSGNVLAQESERRLFQPEDIHRLQYVSSIAVAPDGEWVAYRVTSTNVDKDTYPSDLYMVSWDGTTRLPLTHTEDTGERHPRFSPDGKYLAFISARGDGGSEDAYDPKEKSQVWLMNRLGGEAERVTLLPGGVSSFEWSPDSSRLVLVSRDPKEKDQEDDSEDAPSHKTPKPIVVDRYLFKQDGRGYLDDRRQRLYVFDLDTREASLLTPGPYDSSEPAWSPDGDIIAFSSKRHGDPDRNVNSDIYTIEAVAGASLRQITTWEGPDSSPVFSPDGKQIAYFQGAPPKYSGYDPDQPVVVSLDGSDPIFPVGDPDIYISSLRWSLDGETLYFLVAEDRIQVLASVPADGGEVNRAYSINAEPGVVRSFLVGKKGLVTLATLPHQPAEIYRADDGVALSDHNGELRDSIAWASVEGVDAISKDGTRVGAMLLKPPGFKEGISYPMIAYIHGGPLGQDAYQFDASSQVFAAQGYLVVRPNYRGSSGRGREFSRAIFADWGNLEIQDIHAVVDKLVEDGLADPERLGIGGWSYGGISTTSAIATDTRFSAGVSGAGSANYIAGYGTDQYTWTYENELGPPWENPEGYLDMSFPFLHADRIKTPTLFMCGELDFNVPLINSEQMYQALRSLNVPTQLVIYPGQYHGLSEPSYVQDRLERMIDWYGRYLSDD